MNINISILKKTLKRFEGRFGFFISALFLKTLLVAVKPFVLLHFSAVIVNDLYSKVNEKQIIFQAFMLSVCIIAMEIGGHLVSRYTESATQRISYSQSLELSNKAMQMNYQLLESARVQSIIENIKQSKFQRGDVFAKEVQFLENLLVGIFAVATSLIYILEFVKEKIASQVHVGQFGMVLVCFFLLVGAIVVITVQNNEKHSKNIFKRFTEVASINQMYGFYRKNVFQNYKYGKEIRIFDEKELIQDEFDKILKDMSTFLRNIGKEEGTSRMVNSMLNVCLSGIAYVYVGINAYHKVIGIGSVVKYSGAITQLFTGITQVVGAAADLKGNEKFLQQYYDFLEMETPSEVDFPLQVEIKREISETEAVEITFENVYFKYPNATKWSLENVSFHISNKEHIAIVGRNGSGKTTCIRLLLRLYKPHSGRILLNGIDIQQYSDKEYWKLMSVVFQDFKIFSINIEENIEGAGLKNKQKLMSVIRDVGMSAAVEKMYAGVKSSLYKDYDEQGVLISGGEAQKLAMAKALYKDSPIFILDEPSSALDPISEAELYENMDTLMKEKTIIFISHRLSSCCFCDRILVLKEGRLAEVGSHEELLSQNGEYQRLWEAQAKFYRKDR